jgi:hypothetical protein
MGKAAKITVKQKRAGKRRLRRKIEQAMGIIEKGEPMLYAKAHTAYTVPGEKETVHAVKELKDVPQTAVILGIVFTDKPGVGTLGYYFYEDEI